MPIVDHSRYKKFTLPVTARNDCCMKENELSFVIFNRDDLLRGHAFHFITPSEFSIGWNNYTKSLNAKDIIQKYNEMKSINCPYVSNMSMEKTCCDQCRKTNNNRYNSCLSIIDKDILDEYVSAVSQILEESLAKPRFSKTKQLKSGRKAKCLIGLCDKRVVVKGELMHDRITYNIVTAYLPDADRYANNPLYVITETARKIKKGI